MNVCAALLGTSAWAIGISTLGGDVRPPIVVAGIVAALSFGVHPCAAGDHAAVLVLGLLLFGYQVALADAVRDRGPAIQAIINCNVVVICAHQAWAGKLPVSGDLAALAVATVASATALVLYGSRAPPAGAL
jgi:hypothetical protein